MISINWYHAGGDLYNEIFLDVEGYYVEFYDGSAARFKSLKEAEYAAMRTTV